MSKIQKSQLARNVTCLHHERHDFQSEIPILILYVRHSLTQLFPTVFWGIIAYYEQAMSLVQRGACIGNRCKSVASAAAKEIWRVLRQQFE